MEPPPGGEGPDDFGSYEAGEGPGGAPLYPEGSLEAEAAPGPGGIPGIPGIPGAPGAPEFLPEFLPSGAQRALFLRIRHKQRPEERPRRGCEAGDREHDEGDPGAWYSSDEDDGASSVSSILKSLRQQSCARPAGTPPGTAPGPGDPPSDPRLARPRLRDPRLARSSELGSASLARSSELGPASLARSSELGSACPARSSELGPGSTSEPPSDPRLARHGAKADAAPRAAPVGAEDDDGERLLRDKPAAIPLEAAPGQAQRDPRSQLQRFSHIRKDVRLLRPPWARSVLWSPEDLIPLPVPKQDLPPPPPHPQCPTSDPRLLRPPSDPRQARGAPTEPSSSSSSSCSSSSSSSSASSLPDFELLSRILQSVTTASGGDNKPSDPRVRKAHPHPHPPPSDPRLQKSLEGGNSRPDPIAPYDPRLSWGSSGQSSSSVLSAISLYDPRTPPPAKEPQNEANSTQKAPAGGVGAGAGGGGGAGGAGGAGGGGGGGGAAAGGPCRAKEAPPFVRRSALEPPPEERPEPGTDRYNSYNRPRAKIPSPGEGGGGQPALHNLPVPPVPPVIGLAKAGARPGTGSPFPGGSPRAESPERDGGADRGSLKDVFKGFDPTASPFCQ